MKKIICILLMLLFALPALAEGTPLAEGAPLAEENPFAPFTLAVPEEVTVEEADGSRTFVHGTTRVVAIRIDRVPDDDPAEAVIRLMGQFDPAAVIGEDVPTAKGFSGVEAVTEDRFGEGIDALTIMLLSHEGDLLILSGYDMTGSDLHVRALLDTLLSGLTVDGSPVVPKTK